MEFASNLHLQIVLHVRLTRIVHIIGNVVFTTMEKKANVSPNVLVIVKMMKLVQKVKFVAMVNVNIPKIALNHVKKTKIVLKVNNVVFTMARSMVNVRMNVHVIVKRMPIANRG